MDDLARIGERLAGVEHVDLRAAFSLRGAVTEVGDGNARVAGLRDIGAEELVAFDSGALGIALELDALGAAVVILRGAEKMRSGEGAEPLRRGPSIPVGNALLGRVLDPLGAPLDDLAPPRGQLRSIFRDAPALIDRAPVRRPLLTGVMAIDSAIPIGRGQRQLIVGDRNVGKTALALDVVVAQRKRDVSCVYVAIGQPLSRILAIRDTLRERHALANTVVIASDAADSPGLQYLAPYAGQTVAEGFRDAGGDALVVFDDLTKHADAYRQIALLLGRPPGREAFPGDIFYVHAELLERASEFAARAGSGSITAFPIVETTDSDIGAYIPTNLVSITDGQIYLDAARFDRDQRPAIDIGRSVSRVGGAAQPALLRDAAQNLRINMARFESLEALTRSGLDVDAATRRAVDRGRLLREALRQNRFAARSVADQVFVLTAIGEGWLDSVPLERVRPVCSLLTTTTRVELADVVTAFDRGEGTPADWKPRARDLVARLVAEAAR